MSDFSIEGANLVENGTYDKVTKLSITTYFDNSGWGWPSKIYFNFTLSDGKNSYTTIREDEFREMLFSNIISAQNVLLSGDTRTISVTISNGCLNCIQVFN